MPPLIAAFVYGALILGLFWLDPERKARTSIALWLPLVWLALAGSRSVNQWVSIGVDELPLADAYGQSLLEGNPVDRFVYSALVVVGLAVLVSRRKQVWALLRQNAPVALFFLYCAASLLWSDFPDVAFKRWIKAIGDLVMVLIVLSDRDPLAAVQRLLARASYLLIPLSVLFIKYYPVIGKTYGLWDWKAFYTGVTTNKNTLGVICLFFGIAALWRVIAVLQGRERSHIFRRLAGQGVILVMVLWLFWIANSMTSLGCFLLASALLVATNLRVVMRRPALVHILAFLVISLSASVLFLNFGPAVLATMGRNSTLTDRTEIWALVISLVKNPLLGTGFESFWLGPRLVQIWSVYSWRPAEAHNGYLEIFLNLGWMGIFLLAVVLVTGYRTVLTVYRRNPSIGSLVLTFFVVGLVYNFTEAAFFRMMAPAWILFLLAIIRVPRFCTAKLGPPREGMLRAAPAAMRLADEGPVPAEGVV